MESRTLTFALMDAPFESARSTTAPTNAGNAARSSSSSETRA